MAVIISAFSITMAPHVSHRNSQQSILLCFRLFVLRVVLKFLWKQRLKYAGIDFLSPTAFYYVIPMYKY